MEEKVARANFAICLNVIVRKGGGGGGGGGVRIPPFLDPMINLGGSPALG